MKHPFCALILILQSPNVQAHTGTVHRNIIISMEWDNNEIKQVSLKTNSDKSIPVIYKKKIFNFNLKKNEVFVHKF